MPNRYCRILSTRTRAGGHETRWMDARACYFSLIIHYIRSTVIQRNPPTKNTKADISVLSCPFCMTACLQSSHAERTRDDGMCKQCEEEVRGIGAIGVCSAASSSSAIVQHKYLCETTRRTESSPSPPRRSPSPPNDETAKPFVIKQMRKSSPIRSPQSHPVVLYMCEHFGAYGFCVCVAERATARTPSIVCIAINNIQNQNIPTLGCVVCVEIVSACVLFRMCICMFLSVAAVSGACRCASDMC